MIGPQDSERGDRQRAVLWSTTRRFLSAETQDAGESHTSKSRQFTKEVPKVPLGPILRFR